MHPISKERFEALVAYTRQPFADGITSKELEWYANENEILLATVIVDCDAEYSSIILGRDVDLKYKCVNLPVLFANKNDARKYMILESKKILNEGMSSFSHDKKNSQILKLFNIICNKKKINQHVKKISSSIEYSSAKEIIEEIMPHFKDVDGNFIKDFQTTGFDARLWELYLFAYLTEERLSINREHKAPDFYISKGLQNVAIEAVTVNPTQRNDSKIEFDKLTPEKIQALLRNYMPMKYGSPLFSKMNRKNKKGKRIANYWEIEHVKGCPFIFAIADFHAEDSMCWSSTALSDYLYGMRHNWSVSDDGQLIITPIKTEFTKENNNSPISGFFSSKDSENVSAVLFSASGTISKFVRMGKIAGFGNSSVGIKYGGVCHNHSSLTLPSKFFFEVDKKYKESWGAGISIFHNPYALYPLSSDIFPSVAHHYIMDDGKIICIPPKFHPYNGLTYMHPISKNISQEDFDSMLTYFSTVTGKTVNW